MRTDPAQRIISGGVNSSGAVSFGTGFMATRTALGQYTVRWTPPLRAGPAVTMMPMGASGIVALGAAADRYSASVFTYAAGGAATDLGFSFEAIGLP